MSRQCYICHLSYPFLFTTLLRLGEEIKLLSFHCKHKILSCLPLHHQHHISLNFVCMSYGRFRDEEGKHIEFISCNLCFTICSNFSHGTLGPLLSETQTYLLMAPCRLFTSPKLQGEESRSLSSLTHSLLAAFIIYYYTYTLLFLTDPTLVEVLPFSQ
jgi:hypothetical protein